MSSHPYADRYDVLRGMPSEGRDPAEILRELREMADLEDRSWEQGKASGSFYCGDKDHYAFMARAFEMYGHMNALQRDVCPSSTRFEGEIIAIALDVIVASRCDDDAGPARGTYRRIENIRTTKPRRRVTATQARKKR